MSYVCCHQNPGLLVLLERAHTQQQYDDLLDLSTPSKPAVWDRSSQSLYRLNLQADDPQLEECKKQIRSIKEDIKIQLIEEFGPYTWQARMPNDTVFESSGK